MKIPVSWLRELVDVPVPPATLARDLHMTGFEVAAVEPVADDPDDAVIDLEITSNRPDCLSMLGLAREVATRYGTALRVPARAVLGPSDAAATGPLAVAIEDLGRCPRYSAALADVTVGPSPDWLARRLAAAGIRAINNIVDVTNYVLLELGHPLHAFDLARLGGPALRIRAARAGERLTTLDGQPRTLGPDMLVIADRDRPQALAGIMGGGESEVTADTTTIALESAWFEPHGIRRTSRQLGLSTEASYRFERGADIEAPPVALARTAALLEAIGAGRVRPGWIDVYPAPQPRRVVHLARGAATRVLGVPIAPEETERILTGLGFEPGAAGADGWHVGVPSWRLDVARDIDLVEELARHHGYDRLPTTFPALGGAPPPPDAAREHEHAIRRLVTAGGFTECVTFSFIARRTALEFAGESDLVAIANPLSETFAVLRPSLLPGLVDAVAHNHRHGRPDTRLFECGRRFTRQSGETRALALAWAGEAEPGHWSRRGRSVDFFDLKGSVETLASGLGLAIRAVPARREFLVPGRTAELLADAGDGRSRPCGVVGQLVPALAALRDLPAEHAVYLAEIDLDGVADLITSLDAPRVQALPRFPAIVRDLSVLVDDTLPAERLRGTIRSAAPPSLVRLTEFDRYAGQGVPQGRVSLSYRLTFQARDRTLTDSDVRAAMEAIVQALARDHGAVQR